MHITQNRIFSKNFSVQQRFHKSFAYGIKAFSGWYAMEYPAFINSGKSRNPNSANSHQKATDEKQPGVKWPYERS
jgi:hypothetical protein